MRSELAMLGICLSALGCAKPPPGGSRPEEARDALANPVHAAPVSSTAARTALRSTEPWAQAIREYRWSDAARLLDALAEPVKSRPEVRYARASVARELGQHADVRARLEGLEQALPLLREDIARMRAESALVAGPFIEAGEYFSARPDAESLVKAALAFEKAKQYDRARKILDQALARLDQQKKGRSRLRAQARARAVRARVAEKKRQIALAAADLRWLATDAATEPDAEGTDLTLERLAPARKLTARERVERAMEMAAKGWVERTDQELRLAAKASGVKPTEAEVCRAEGLARSVAREDCKRAGELLERAAELDGSRRMRDLLEAARAWSRTDDEARALRIYADIARRAPRTGWADHASYYGARLHLVRASYGEAADAFSHYLEQFGIRAAHAKAATYFRAVAWLASGEDAKAAAAFEKLATDERTAHLKARYLELWAVALQGLKQEEQAREVLRRVLRESPLSFPALLAAARLREAGEEGPIYKLPVLSVQPAPALRLPPKVALLRDLGLDADAEAALADEEAGLRQAHGARAVEALCTAYSELSPARRRYKVGSQALRSPDLAVASEPWARWLWECNYPRPYPTLVAPVEEEFKLPCDFIYAVMRQESAFSPDAASPAQAVGLLQIIPPTAERIAAALRMDLVQTDCENPAQAIRMGGYYLKQLLDTFGGNLVLATAAYNAGPSAVSRWLESGETLPLDVFAARIPFDETRGYVAHVLGNYARYVYLAGGAEALPELSLKITPGLRATHDAY
jgi:soluble lytic murein transglycosylase